MTKHRLLNYNYDGFSFLLWNTRYSGEFWRYVITIIGFRNIIGGSLWSRYTGNTILGHLWSPYHWNRLNLQNEQNNYRVLSYDLYIICLMVYVCMWCWKGFFVSEPNGLIFSQFVELTMGKYLSYIWVRSGSGISHPKVKRLNPYSWSYRNQTWYVGWSFDDKNVGDNFKVIQGHPEVKRSNPYSWSYRNQTWYVGWS